MHTGELQDGGNRSLLRLSAVNGCQVSFFADELLADATFSSLLGYSVLAAPESSLR